MWPVVMYSQSDAYESCFLLALTVAECGCRSMRRVTFTLRPCCSLQNRRLYLRLHASSFLAARFFCRPRNFRPSGFFKFERMSGFFTYYFLTVAYFKRTENGKNFLLLCKEMNVVILYYRSNILMYYHSALKNT